MSQRVDPLSLFLSLFFLFFFFTIHKLRTGSGGNPQIYARRSADTGRSSPPYTKWDRAVYMLSQQNKHSDIMENFPFLWCTKSKFNESIFLDMRPK